MILLYGAYGYTGALIARDAQAKGIPLLLAGRDEARLQAISEATGHPYRAFPLDAPDLSGVEVVLHAAGPFSRTSRPMVDACLAAKAHYLDITGEIAVFEACAARHAEAEAAGIVLLPGVGFDVVPSDCLAAHVHRRLPTATHLVLAWYSHGTPSHGTATTWAQHLGGSGAVRRGGKIVEVPLLGAFRTVAFGDKDRETMRIPWGDVSTAWHSTGIPDIEVYTKLPGAGMAAARWGRPFFGLLGLAPVRRAIQARIDAAPAGPSDEARRTCPALAAVPATSPWPALR
jgi:short subunit dehydrogenase-like uncharacterized protein